MEYIIIGWLVFFIIFVGLEMISLRLISIWFAGGALAAFVLAVLEFHLIFQLAAFIVFSLLLLIARPCTKSFINSIKDEKNEI